MSSIVAVGSEIIECLRIARLIEKHGERFLRRTYTANEIRACSSTRNSTQEYAALWAGKEAILHALNVKLSGEITMLDIELRRPDSESQFRVGFGGQLKEVIVQRDIGVIHVSAAHCRNYATAHAIVLGE